MFIDIDTQEQIKAPAGRHINSTPKGVLGFMRIRFYKYFAPMELFLLQLILK